MHIPFLRGLFEDGSIHLKNGVVDYIEWCTSYPEMEKIVRVMLLRLGIISGTVRSKRYPNIMIYGEQAAKFGNLIDEPRRVNPGKSEKEKTDTRRKHSG